MYYVSNKTHYCHSKPGNPHFVFYSNQSRYFNYYPEYKLYKERNIILHCRYNFLLTNITDVTYTIYIITFILYIIYITFILYIYLYRWVGNNNIDIILFSDCVLRIAILLFLYYYSSEILITESGIRNC